MNPPYSSMLPDFVFDAGERPEPTKPAKRKVGKVCDPTAHMRTALTTIQEDESGPNKRRKWVASQMKHCTTDHHPTDLLKLSSRCLTLVLAHPQPLRRGLSC